MNTQHTMWHIHFIKRTKDDYGNPALEIRDENDSLIAPYHSDDFSCESISEANARRIVACVNACAGVSDSDLDLIAKGGGFRQITTAWSAALHEAEQQRDDLLAAARLARRALAHADSKAPGLYGAEYASLDAAIAKAKGAQ